MKTHPNNAAVLEQASRALANLAYNDDNQVAIAAAGGITVRIAALLGHHLSDPPLHTPHVIPFPLNPNYRGIHDPRSYICPNANSNKSDTQPKSIQP